MATIRAADGGYLLNSEQFNYTKDAQGRPVLNVVGGGGGTVTEADIENALGYKPIGADDVPVKSVNGAIGEVKSTFYVTVTQGDDGSVTVDKTAEEVYAAYAAGYAVYAIANLYGYDIPTILPMVVGFKHSDLVLFTFGVLIGLEFLVVEYDGSAWSILNGMLASSEDIPTIPEYLPNPNALNIKIGDTTTIYDGSAAKTVEIPEGVPPFTAADNDKVLGIVNGALAWVTKT